MDAKTCLYKIQGNDLSFCKGYYITDKCIGCGKCLTVCPQNCIDKGTPKPYTIRQNNCLHCGACFEKCPTGAIIRL